ncbi:leucine-rich repeat-containing protein egg-6-like [Anopheles aquasalis]|uniref:leucine-rich repeat-containing protein egg-6-like n=1 Tax=Anopheles aquasalis TaxID=42839 RepID=UPI00215AC99C|nr:leucine-rich repeat-containing protein egg-6-like [Anopheles aquasalis]
MKLLVILLIVVSSVQIAWSVNCSIESFEYAPSIADEFCVLKGLKTDVATAGNKLTDPSITRVAIENSSLNRLTAAFYERFPRLEHLIVRDNGLEQLHITGNVRIIDASGNKIKSVTVQGGGSLRELNLRNNPISDISPISRLVGLTKLNLGNSSIKEDPFSFDLTLLCHLTNLTELIFDELDIFYLDNTRNCTLPNLRVLDLSRNSFIHFNFKLDLFRNMPKLEVILLRNCLVSNPIVQFEELRSDFPSLKKIYLEGNRFTCSFLSELLAHLKANGIEPVEPEQSEFCDERFRHVANMCCDPLNVSPSDTKAGITTAQMLEEMDWLAKLQLAHRNLKRVVTAHLDNMRKKNILLSLFDRFNSR